MILIVNEYSRGSESDEFLETVLNKVVLDSNGKPFENWKYTELIEPSEKVITQALFDKNFDEEAFLKKSEKFDKIILLGERASKRITGQMVKVGIKKPFNAATGQQIYCNYSPAQVLENESLQQPFLELFDRVFNNIEIKTTPFKIIESAEEIKQVFDWCRQEKVCCFDFETSGTEYWIKDFHATVLSISFQAGFSYIIPIKHFEYAHASQEVLQMFFDILEDKDVIKIGHNIKFDFHVAKTLGQFKIKGRILDTMLMHHLLDENTKQDLKTLSAMYFPHTENYEIKPKDWALVPMTELAPYAATDTDNTFKLAVMFEDMLIEDDDKHLLYVSYRNLSVPTMITLLELEHSGAKVDKHFIEQSIEFAEEVLEELGTELLSYKEVHRFEDFQREQAKAKAISEVEAKMLTAKGKNLEKYEEKLIGLRSGELGVYEGINLNSPKQLGDLLFDKEGFGLPLYKKGKEYIKTTDKTALSTYKGVPFIDSLSKHRSVAKMISTYYKGLLEKADLRGYIHPNFLQLVATGRLACTEPNVQNIPNRIPKGTPKFQDVYKRIKKFFVVEEDYVILQADFKQAELRIIAIKSKDETMLTSYKNGIDLHAVTATKIYGKSIEQMIEDGILKENRQVAKSAIFGWVYGSSLQGYIDYVYKMTGDIITKKTAESHSDAVFGVFTKLRKWHEKSILYARKHGYIRTMFGRKRRLPDINSSNERLKGDAERQAINSPIQGSSGEWTLFALSVLRMILPKDVFIFNTVHDSGMFYIPKSKLDFLVPIIADIASEPPLEEYFGIRDLPIPMQLDFEVSDVSWGDIKELKLS